MTGPDGASGGHSGLPWEWWREMWDEVDDRPPTCVICQASEPLTLLDRRASHDGDARSTDLLPLCLRCAARVEELVAARCSPGGCWAGMPRPVAVDSLVAALSLGRIPLDEG